MVVVRQKLAKPYKKNERLITRMTNKINCKPWHLHIRLLFPIKVEPPVGSLLQL
jgi:hypothetical protein